VKYLDIIRAFLAVNVEPLTNVAYVDVGEWQLDEDRLHTPFGFGVPTDVDGELEVRICPELIAAHVDHLDDEELVTDYLMFIEHHINLHCIHFNSLAGDEIERLIDRVSLDSAPAISAMASRVQMHALEVNHA
jgi:hypothetical protein